MTRPPKYRNRRTEVDGITFASAKEARRYRQLKLLERAGEIADLELQPSFVLSGQDGDPLRYDTGRAVTYKADFRYYDIRKQIWVIEDAKGFATRTYKLKKAVMRGMGLPVVET